MGRIRVAVVGLDQIGCFILGHLLDREVELIAGYDDYKSGEDLGTIAGRNATGITALPTSEMKSDAWNYHQVLILRQKNTCGDRRLNRNMGLSCGKIIFL